MKTIRNSITKPAKGSVEIAKYFVDNPTNDSPKGFGSLHMLQLYTGVATTGAVLHGIIGNINDRIATMTATTNALFNTLIIFGVSILFNRALAK